MTASVLGLPIADPGQYHFDEASYTRTITLYAEGRAPFKVRVVPESAYHGSIFCHIAEIDIKTRFWRGFGPGDCVLDAGHGFGAYSLPPAALGAEVWAIDPEGLSKDYLGFKLTCEANGMFERRMHIRRYLLGKEIDASSRYNGGAVPTVTIDSLEQPFTWINLDTEGAELDILQGATETLRKYKPRILLENHLFIDADCEKKHDAFLAQFGYRKLASMPEGACTHSFYQCG